MNIVLNAEAVSKLAIVSALAKKSEEATVKLAADEDKVSVSIFLDAETMLETSVAATVTESGECVLKAFRLKNALRQYKDGKITTITTKGGFCRVIPDGDETPRVEIALISSPFNKLSFDETDCFVNISLSGEKALALLSDVKTSYTRSFDNAMPVMSLTRLKVSNGELAAESVDLGRFTKAILPLDEKKERSVSLNITNDLAKKVVDIIRAFHLSDADVVMKSSIKTNRVIVGDVVLTGKKVILSDNDLITSQQDIYDGKNKKFHCVVNADEIKNFCFATTIISDEQGDVTSRTPVNIAYNGEMLNLKYVTIDGNVYRNVPIKVVRDELHSFNISVILKALYQSITRFNGEINVFVDGKSLLLMSGSKDVAETEMKQFQLLSLVR